MKKILINIGKKSRKVFSISLNSTKKSWDPGLKFGYKSFVENTILTKDYKPLQKIKILFISYSS